MIASTIDLFHCVHLPEMESAALSVMRSGQIASGANITALERAFAFVAGREHIVSTNDLTSAVTLALHLAGVRAGDEVAAVAFSCLQSNSPIARLGARPVWVDLDLETMSMSAEDLSTKLRPSVKAVMVYHIAGYPADTESIAALCKDWGIPLIEDCNNALGAVLNGRPVGVTGDFSVYSLYPNRQINGIDGGMLAASNAETASRAARLRRFGIDSQSFRDARGEINSNSDVYEIGWSAALSNLNAAIALAQLDTLAERRARTQMIAARLTNELSSLNHLSAVRPVAGALPAFWGFFVKSEHRDALLAHLKAHRINPSILHRRNDWYSGFGAPRADLPNTELLMSQLLALPCGYWLSDAQVNELICRVTEFDGFEFPNNA
jgi:dTDP-4-amino-4,6-dideoxygalactose transaminase